MRRFGRLACSAALLGTLVGVWTLSATAADDLKVGVMLPMTGASALSGAEGMIGFKMATDEINAAGGVMGRKIVLVEADDQSNPTIAVNETRRLIEQERVEAIVGPISSQNSLAMAPILEENRTLAFSVSGSAAITPEKAPYVFSSLFSSDGQAEAMFLYAHDVLGAKKVAILGESGAQARAGVKKIQELAGEKGVVITSEQVFDPKTPDMTPQLLALRRDAPEILFVYTTIQEDSATAVKNLREIGWNIKVVAANNMASSAPFVSQMVGADAYRDIFATLAGFLTYCPGEAVGTGKYAEFLARLKAYAPGQFAKLSPRNVIQFYSDVYILKAGIEGAKSTDADAIRQWLETSPVDLVIGTGRASAKSHFMISAQDLQVVLNPDKPREDGLVQRASRK